MFRWGRWRGLPKRLRPPFDADERTLAWATTPTDGAVVVATNLGLWLPGRTSRLGWHEIHKASWTQPKLTVVAAVQIDSGPGYAIMADLGAESTTLAVPGDVPRTVRLRVSRSVALTQYHQVPGGGGVRVVARRVPGVDGLSWHVRFEDGASHTDLAALDLATELVTQAREPATQRLRESDEPGLEGADEAARDQARD